MAGQGEGEMFEGVRKRRRMEAEMGKRVKNQRRMKTQFTQYLPDDLLMEILARIPAKDVARSRAVCHQWRDLTSSQYFVKRHLENINFPTIVVQEKLQSWAESLKMQLLDGWEVPRKKTRVHEFEVPSMPLGYEDAHHMYSSCDGLVAYRVLCTQEEESIHLVNPLTREKVKIITPRWSTLLCGMFFNPQVKEYCLLLASFNSELTQFKMLILDSNPYRKISKLVLQSCMNQGLPMEVQWLWMMLFIGWFPNMRKGFHPVKNQSWHLTSEEESSL